MALKTETKKIKENYTKECHIQKQQFAFRCHGNIGRQPKHAFSIRENNIIAYIENYPEEMPLSDLEESLASKIMAKQC